MNKDQKNKAFFRKANRLMRLLALRPENVAADRAQVMAALKNEDGMTIQQIADAYGCSKQFVSAQIIHLDELLQKRTAAG